MLLWQRTVLYYVYVLFSIERRKTSVGRTSDLGSRMLSHNFLSTKGYTLRFIPWVLLHTEGFETKKQAALRERELKTGKGREFIRRLVNEKYGAKNE